MDLAFARHFQIEGEPLSLEPHGNGHINRTFLLTCSSQKRYILQRISDVFNVGELMENIIAICDFLAEHAPDPKNQLSLVYTTDGNPYYTDATGSYRMYHYIEHSITLERCRSYEDFHQCGRAFGEFFHLMCDFDAQRLHEHLPKFHNTPNRYRIFEETLAKDVLGRSRDAAPEIAFALARKESAAYIQDQQDRGLVPLRVCHGDTKLNNVLFDEKTGMVLACIDLDSAMPGLAAADVGDAVRFGASTAAEDEEDLSKVHFDAQMYRSFIKGFIGEFPELTEEEIASFPYAVRIITLECGVRFLTDYLDGDHYFITHKPRHNLIRCRTQFALVKEMEAQFDQMIAITQAEAALLR